MTIPNFIVHYSRSEPYRSISAIPTTQRDELIKSFNEKNTWGLNRFSDPEYLKRRIETETKMKELFISKGGEPSLEHPIYFFLGRNLRFEEYKANIGYAIQLKDLTSEVVSFTYGDSMICFNKDYRQKLGGEYLNKACLDIYLLENLNDLYSNILVQPNPLHVECQLWINPEASGLTTTRLP